MPLDATTPARWSPQPGPQHDAINMRAIGELLFGGARGGGKSSYLLGDYCADASIGKPWRGILLRRSYPELEELIRLSEDVVPQCWPGSEWAKAEKTWHIPTGATLRMRNLERPEDAASYMGHAYSWIGFDELTNWPTDEPYRKMLATLRSAENVPHKRIRATANPGGPGHEWVKRRFVDAAPLGYELVRDEQSSLVRIFIPSRVTDNKILLASDPGYIDRLKMVGSEALVRAWLLGDWSVVQGAYFPEFGQQHILRPFAVPHGWLRFRAMDWGSARPFCVLWCAISDGSTRWLPVGSMIVYREWYGASEPNVGLRLPAEAVADGIREREIGDEPMAYSIADPAIFASDGGPSIAERFANKRIMFKPADNKRMGKLGASQGWDLIRHRLVGEDGSPMLYVFNTCTNLIRTLPALQHDPARPEDVDCWVAGTMVATPDGERPIENIRPGDVVDTPIGPRIVTHSYLSGTSETVRAVLSNGRTLEGTPRHKIYVRGRGLIALSDLSCHMVLAERIIWSRSLNIAVSFIAAMRAASITIRAVVASVCTARSGLMRATAYPTVGTFITGTAITTTTPWLTSNAYRVAFTHGNTWSNAWRVTLDSGLRHGVAHALASNSFGGMPQKCGQIPPSVSCRASIVAALSTLDSLCSVSVVKRAHRRFRTLYARFAESLFGKSLVARSRSAPVHIVAVGRYAGEMPVYNLTVADANLFYANGILSANTRGEDHAGDTLRYACASRPWVRAPAPEPAELNLNFLWERRERERRAWH